ncbi:MAG: translation initiation factor IF-2 [Planctomycetota bacterium]
MQQDVIPDDLPESVTLEEPASIKDLSLALGVKQAALLKKLMNHGKLANVNSPLTEEITDILSVEINCEIILEEPHALQSSLEELEKFEDSDDDLMLRAPVVTLMGHVDHGKTTLLDKIRTSSITKSESGGITQHMSAYRVDKGDAHVVFVDTPGHRAFTSMRARGANVTDVVVLVVAADDGPMPQTEEAIEHARAAEVPIVVAINKIDRPGANPDKVKARLAELELSPVEWGGTTEMLSVSGITGEGIDELLEHLSLESELLELKANPQKNAIGTVLDSRASTGQGNVITALIQDGTLRRGDAVVCGPAYGKIKTLRSTTGEDLESAPPSTPVEITGLNDLPEAGDRLYALDDAAKAKQIAEERQEAKAKADRAERQKVTLEGLFDTIDQAKVKEINVVLKSDVKGTLDVLKNELSNMKTEEVAVRVIRAGVGEISESDVLLADASSAIVIGFHVTASDRARNEAEVKGVEIRTYQVIYEVLDETRLALEGMLSPDVTEEVQGSVEILQLFRSSKLGNIAGCIGRTGVLTRNDKVRLTRDGIVVHEGKLASLKRVKDDIKEVREGFECGVVIQGYNDVKPGDIIESIKVTETSRKFDESETLSE